MICAVYKSSRKAETYLFVTKRDYFDDVPAPLMEMFGTPSLVMLLPLEKRSELGIADMERVKQELADKGFYLQLPPPVANLLDEHKQEIGYSRD